MSKNVKIKQNRAKNNSKKVPLMKRTKMLVRNMSKVSLVIIAGIIFAGGVVGIVYAQNRESNNAELKYSEQESKQELAGNPNTAEEVGLVQENQNVDQEPQASGSDNNKTTSNSSVKKPQTNKQSGTAFSVPIGHNFNDYGWDYDTSKLPTFTASFSPTSINIDRAYNINPEDDLPKFSSLVEVESNYYITDMKFSGYDTSKIRPAKSNGITQGSTKITYFVEIAPIMDMRSTSQGSTQLTITAFNGNGASVSKTISYSWNIYPFVLIPPIDPTL